MGKKFMGYDNASELITAIGNKIKAKYSKPSGGIPKSDLATGVQSSLGKADSALQSETDPTVPSWAKQTNKPSYNSDEISDDNRTHKFATSAQLTQIETNKNNILYNLDNGVKNLLDLSTGEIAPSVTTHSVTWTIADGKGVVANGTSDSSGSYPNIAKLTLPVGTYKMSGGTSRIKFRYEGIVDSGSGATLTVNENTTQPVSFIVYAIPNTTFSNETIYPMLCTEEAWNQSHDYQPPAKSNSTLTRLESEDHASLAEVVDSGAKNLLDISRATFGDRSKITFNADGSVTGAITDDARYWSWANSEFKFTLPAGSYVLYFVVTSGTNTNCGVALRKSDNSEVAVVNIYTGKDFVEFTLTSATEVGFMGKIFDRRMYVMLCTKAAFDVSQKFVPYRMPYADTLSVLDERAPKSTDGTISGRSMDDFNSGCVLCTSNVTGGPKNAYCYVRTRVYDSNCVLQQVFYPSLNTAYQRCKWAGTWSEWKQFVS